MTTTKTPKFDAKRSYEAIAKGMHYTEAFAKFNGTHLHPRTCYKKMYRYAQEHNLPAVSVITGKGKVSRKNTTSIVNPTTTTTTRPVAKKTSTKPSQREFIVMVAKQMIKMANEM